MNDKNITFYGGPLNGQQVPAAAATGYDGYEDSATYSGYTRTNATSFIYTGDLASLGRTTPVSLSTTKRGKRLEVTVRGNKLMTIGEIAQFEDAAREAGYPEDHVPRVENSMSGRPRALIAKD